MWVFIAKWPKSNNRMCTWHIPYLSSRLRVRNMDSILFSIQYTQTHLSGHEKDIPNKSQPSDKPKRVQDAERL